MIREGYTLWSYAGILVLSAGLSCASGSGTQPAPETGGQTEDIMPEANYFSSPREAVPVIAKLLRDEDFETLAKYYHLSGSDIPRSELESGSFFIRKKRPEASHPGGFWKYKHPFAPGFEYAGERPGPRKGVFIIEVSVSIDQGQGAPVQRGMSLFYMIASDKGWQILPDPVSEAPPAQVPVMAE